MTMAALTAALLVSSALRADPLDDVLVHDLDARLASLTPERPMEYFRLAEEVAYESRSQRGVRLARRLYVLSFELDGDGTLARSACLGLAELSTTDDERRWLLAMAEALDRRSGPSRWSRLAAREGRGDGVEILATALARFHTGSYRQVHPALDSADVQSLLSTLSVEGRRVIEMIRLELQRGTVCRQCQNARVVQEGSGDKVRLCPICGGDPGPRLTPEELEDVFALEARLRNASTESWSARVMIDGGAPLRDVDPNQLSAWFSIDPTRPYWRDGGWASDPAPPVRDDDAAEAETNGESSDRQGGGPDLP